MSTFGTPSAGSRVLRANAPRTRLTGITETLNTPGLAVPPPVSAGANTAAQLLSLIEQVGGTANVMNAYVRQGQADERRRQAEAEQAEADRQRAEREAATVMRGKAELDKPAILAKYGALIQSGKLSVPSDYNAFINKIVQEEAGGETNPDYINQLRKSIGEGLAGEFQQQQVQQARAADAQIEAAHSAAAFANPADAPKVFAEQQRLYPNKTTAQQLSPIYEAAKRKAEIGSEDYKTLAASLPDSIFGIAKDELRAKYETARTRFTTAKTQAAEDVIGQYRYGGNYPGALAALQGFVDAGVIDGEKANTIKKGIEEEQQSSLATAYKQADDAFEKKVVDDYMAGVDSQILSGQIWRVGDYKKEVTLPGGKTKMVEVSGQAAREQRINAIMFKSAGVANPGEFDIPPATPQNLDLAAVNGYVPGGWMRVTGNGYTTLSVNRLNDPKAPVPQSSLTGYALYRDIAARAPNLISRLDGDQPDATKFYRMVDTLVSLPEYQTPTGPNVQAAMTDAFRRSQTRGLPDELKQVELSNAANALMDGPFWNNAENKGEAYTPLRNIADGYVTAGMAPKDAIEKASEILKKNSIIVNKRWIGNVDPSIQGYDREQLPSIAQEYLEGFATPQRKASDISLKPVSPNANTPGLYVVDKNGLPIEPYTQTTWRAIIEQHRKKQGAATVAKQNRNQEVMNALPGGTLGAQELYAKSTMSTNR